MDAVKILIAQLLKSEEVIASWYPALDPPNGLPAADDVKRLYGQLKTENARLTAVVRGQPDAVRLAVVTEHLKAHRALKLFAGDLFLVDLELARSASAPPPGKPSAAEQARTAFGTFLSEWVAASPLIHPDTAQRLWPNISNLKAFGSARVVGETVKADMGEKPVSPLELANDAVKRELRRVTLNPADPVLSDTTVHLLGMAYVLAQVELAMRFEKDQSYQEFVAGWYEAAKRPMDAIVATVGCLDRPILETIRDGDPLSLDRLQRSREELVATLSLTYSLPDWPCATLAGFPKPGAPTEIVGVNEVTEKTTRREAIVFNDMPVNRQDMLGYLADTGFPLIHPRRGPKPASAPAPRFGRVARAVLARAKLQHADHVRQIRFSVSETVTEQHELIADLISLESVRDAFKRTIGKQPRIDLVDRTSRGSALTAAMRSQVGRSMLSNDQALLELIGFIRRYLHFFTRHTGDNMRDKGTAYLSSKWPTDLNGRQFFDCGIYAVETAFDLMRIANAAKGMTLRFRFLLIPEHVALIIYHEETSFCVNNADIFDPRLFPQGVVDKEAAAGLSWARDVTQPLYDRKFAIIAAALTPKPLSSRTSDALFKSAIWTLYQLLMGFGITQAVRTEFFKALDAFDAGCGLLCGHLIELLRIENTGATTKELEDSLDAASRLADQLYGMIELLATPILYSDDNSLGLVSSVLVHVSDDNALVQRTRLSGQLPVYRFIDFLNQAKLKPTPLQQQLMGRKTGSKHLDDLNILFRKDAPRGAQDFKDLNGKLSAAHAAVQQFIAAAPRVHAITLK